MAWPFTATEASGKSQSTLSAISSGVPGLSAYASPHWLSIRSIMGVSTGPGHTALTRMPGYSTAAAGYINEDKLKSVVNSWAKGMMKLYYISSGITIYSGCTERKFNI